MSALSKGLLTIEPRACGEPVPLRGAWCEAHGTPRKMQLPGIEPGSPAWQASIIPLDHSCCSMTII